jgi:hypothetical protein
MPAAKKSQATEKPRQRRVAVIVTDTEFRALRIAAAAHDTSIQGYITNAVLKQLQGADRSHLDAAMNSRP